MNGQKLKAGFIGCGGIADQKYFPGIKANSTLCEMVAFCDSDETRATKAAQTWGIKGAKVYSDYKKLIAQPDIDVVFVMTPNVSHAPIVVEAFAAGKHVMCEKPMAATTEDAQRMLEAWEKSGMKFTVGYQNRFRPEVQSLYKMVRAGELGEIYFAKAMAVRRRAVPTWGVFANKSLQGGGPLIDIGTHALDMTLWMMNNYEPASVSGSVFYKLGGLQEATEGNLFGPWDPKTYEVEDSAFGFIKMKNGATIMLESSWALNVLESREASTTLCGTKAGAEIRSGVSFPKDQLVLNRGAHGQLLDETLCPDGKINFTVTEDGQDLATVELKQWLEALHGKGEALVKPAEAFMVTKILDSIYKSAKSGKEVTF